MNHVNVICNLISLLYILLIIVLIPVEVVPPEVERDALHQSAGQFANGTAFQLSQTRHQINMRMLPLIGLVNSNQ